MMRVAHLTILWPSPARPAYGCFVQRIVEAIGRGYPDIQQEVFFINGADLRWNYAKAAVEVLAGKLRRFDLVHAHMHYAGAIARLGWWGPQITSFYGTDVLSPKHRPLSQVVARLSSRSVVLTEEMARYIAGAAVIPVGIDVPHFRRDRQEARQRLGIPADATVALFASDPARPEKRFPLWEATVRQLGITPLIMGMNRTYDEVPDCYAAADLMLLTSLYEGSAIAVKESVAAGCRVVSVDVGEVRKTLDGLGPGYAVADPADLTAACRRVLGETPRPTVPASLAIEATAKALVEQYCLAAYAPR